MSNLFDNIQKAVFSTASDTFGYDAAWQPSDGSNIQTARVLLKEPTKEAELGGIEYSPFTYIAEFHQPALVGLKDAVDNNLSEKLTINNIEYYVRKVDAIWDGQTFRAILEKLT